MGFNTLEIVSIPDSNIANTPETPETPETLETLDIPNLPTQTSSITIPPEEDAYKHLSNSFRVDRTPRIAPMRRRCRRSANQLVRA